MKTPLKLFITLCAAFLLLAAPATVLAQTPPNGQTYNGDRTVIGDTFRLESGDTLNGDLAIIGGTVDLEEGSTVNGDIAVFGGQLDVSGTVTGNLVATGGNVDLNETAVINGSVEAIGSTINRADGAQVEDGVNIGGDDFDPGNLPDFRPGRIDGRGPFDVLTGLFVNVLQILGFSVLALVIVLLLPRYSLNVINTMAAQPVLAGGIGLLTMVLLPFVAVLLALLAITIILIPVTLIGFMVIAAALALGWIAVGYELGKLLETSLKQDWAEPVVAGIGTLMLGVGSWLVSMIPCIGWFLIVLVAAVGLGAVVLSRFGTQLNLPNPPAAPVTAITPVTPVPPPPPVPPAAPWIDPDPIVPAPPAAPSQPDDPQI